MDFKKPTNKSEMYDILQDIFYYYRIKREGGIEMVLEPLSLPRMSYTPMSDEELTKIAQKIAKPSVERERYTVLRDANRKRNEIKLQIDRLPFKKLSEQTIIEKNFDKRREAVQAEALKRGMANSTIITQQVNEIEQERTAEIIKLQTKYSELETQLNDEYDFSTTEISNLQNFYYNLLDYEAAAKKQELIVEQQKIEREVEKYNTGLDEEEQKYQNSIIRQQANLELKFKELNVEPFTKDQLVEMGYYEQVIECVCGYYDTLPAMDAYQDFTNEHRLATYLDDYYVNVLYLYRVKAGQ